MVAFVCRSKSGKIKYCLGRYACERNYEQSKRMVGIKLMLCVHIWEKARSYILGRTYSVFKDASHALFFKLCVKYMHLFLYLFKLLILNFLVSGSVKHS